MSLLCSKHTRTLTLENLVSAKPDRFSLNRMTPSADGANTVTFKAESKDEGSGVAILYV